jgi:uncharacterized RDD family membrane protein YckC
MSAAVGPPPAVNGTGSAYAGLVTRLVAFAADAAIINAVAIGVGLVVAVGLSLFHLPHDVEVVLAAIGAAAALAWSIGYFTFFWSTTGQTPGDRMLSIEVRRENGEGLHAGRAFLRVLALPLSVIPFGAGLVLILFDRRRRALHDLLVGTVVVYVVKVPRAQLASTSLPPSSATRRPNRISAG